MKKTLKNNHKAQVKLIKMFARDGNPEIRAAATAALIQVKSGGLASVWLGSLLSTTKDSLLSPEPAPGYRERHSKSNWWQLIQHWTAWAHNDDL